MKNKLISRRNFIKTAAATTSSALIHTSVFGEIYPGSVLGANDRVNMGFIGVGNR